MGAEDWNIGFFWGAIVLSVTAPKNEKDHVLVIKTEE